MHWLLSSVQHGHYTPIFTHIKIMLVQLIFICRHVSKPIDDVDEIRKALSLPADGCVTGTTVLITPTYYVGLIEGPMESVNFVYNSVSREGRRTDCTIIKYSYIKEMELAPAEVHIVKIDEFEVESGNLLVPEGKDLDEDSLTSTYAASMFRRIHAHKCVND